MRKLLLPLVLAASLLPQAANAWWQQDWSYRKPVSVDTTPKGANIAEPLGRMPVLVRLHAGNFQFDGVQEKGADLRFVAADDKTPLNSQVEQFDPLLGMALVWVDVPAVAGGARQDLWMYYGNAKAAASTSASPFDADYTAVYHFDGTSGAAPTDATAYHNNAQAGVAVGEGLIGQAAKLDGKNGIALPASESLKVGPGGAMTVGAWIRAEANANGALFVRRDAGNALVVGLANGVPYVRLGQQQAAAQEALGAQQWTHVAVAAGNGDVVLLVNGKEVAKLAASLPALTGPTTVGIDPSGDQPGFVGDIDELRISRVRRPTPLLAAEAAMQGSDSKLVAYGPDEKQAGGGFGEIGFILNNVPVDAVVIVKRCACTEWIVVLHLQFHIHGLRQGPRPHHWHYVPVRRRVQRCQLLLRCVEIRHTAFRERRHGIAHSGRRVMLGANHTQSPHAGFNHLQQYHAGGHSLLWQFHHHGLKSALLIALLQCGARALNIFDGASWSKEWLDRFLDLDFVEHRVTAYHVLRDIEARRRALFCLRCLRAGNTGLRQDDEQHRSHRQARALPDPVFAGRFHTPPSCWYWRVSALRRPRCQALPCPPHCHLAH